MDRKTKIWGQTRNPSFQLLSRLEKFLVWLIFTKTTERNRDTINPHAELTNYYFYKMNQIVFDMTILKSPIRNEPNVISQPIQFLFNHFVLMIDKTAPTSAGAAKVAPVAPCWTITKTFSTRKLRYVAERTPLIRIYNILLLLYSSFMNLGWTDFVRILGPWSPDYYVD